MLSDVKCKHATSEGRKIKKLPDSGGLYLWVFADGKKYWRLRYSLLGKEKCLSLGVYPRIGLKDARRRRDVELRRLDNNLDPAAERRAEKIKAKNAAANSFEAVAREWHGKQKHLWVPHHAADVLRRLEKNSFPQLGRRPIAEIDAPELLAAMRKIEARGAHDLAHRVLQVCGQVFRYGIVTGRCTRNVAMDLRGALTPHKKGHQAAVKSDELPELMRAIATYDDGRGTKQTRMALQLLALTFVRTSELIHAEWTEFDLEEALWIIPAERMKMRDEHVVPLSRQAVAILKELLKNRSVGPYVFSGLSPRKPISNNTMLFALYRLGYKGRMTGHGFRAVASTILNEMGFRGDVIERQLAHNERNAVRAAYNRAEYIAERTEMMQTWANHLDAIADGAKVLPFRSARS